MKNLNFEKMETLQGGGNAQAILCGIGIGLMFTPSFMIGGAIAALACLTGDSSQ